MTDDARATPLVSLILVSYNSAPLLPAFFAALAATAYPRYEIIVVDNASRDRSAEAARRLEPRALVLANDANLGFGRACNQGAAAARGDYLLFLNADVLVTPGWLGPLVRHMQGHPRIAILCPQTLYPGEPPIPPGAEPLARSAAVPGCAMMVRREAWRALGGFDERIFLYWEDTELCWRAWLLGWQVCSDRESIVYHERGGSGGGGGWDAQQARNGLYTHLKLMPRRRVARYAARQALATAAKIALGRGRGLPGAWGWNLRGLGLTLAQRRAVAAERAIDPAELEALIDIHERTQARQRRERRRAAPR